MRCNLYCPLGLKSPRLIFASCPAKGWAFAAALLAIHPLAASQTTSGAQQQERRIYQTDSVGNVKYHAPSWTIQSDGRVIETNPYGDKMHHKRQYKVVGSQVIPVDSVGNPQPHKGAAKWR